MVDYSVADREVVASIPVTLCKTFIQSFAGFGFTRNFSSRSDKQKKTNNEIYKVIYWVNVSVHHFRSISEIVVSDFNIICSSDETGGGG